MKGVFLILAVFLLASCGQEHDADLDDGTPRVRLVKGNEVLFHILWDRPLQVEQVIEVQFNERIQDSGTLEWKSTATRYLFYFPAGAVISEPVRLDLNRWHTYRVKILPAHIRNAYTLPAPAWMATETSARVGGGIGLREQNDIIPEGYDFKPYELGFPSSLSVYPPTRH